MMKKLYNICIATALVASFSAGSLLAQDVYEDNFDAPKDYLKDGPSGIWTGLLYNNGVFENNPEAEIFALNTTFEDNQGLTIDAANTQIESGVDNGAFLYRVIPANRPFDVKVQITYGSFPSIGDSSVNYLFAGLMARTNVTDTTMAFVTAHAFDRANWNAVFGMKYGYGTVDSDLDTCWTPNHEGSPMKDSAVSILDYPWIGLSRDAANIDKYTMYASMDGEVWGEVWSIVFDKLRDKELQVGLYQATYSTSRGWVTFDNYKLEVGAGVSVNNLNKSSNVKVYATTSNIVVQASNDELSAVRVYTVDGRLMKSIKTVSNKVTLSVANAGMYVVVTETKAGETNSQKVVVR